MKYLFALLLTVNVLCGAAVEFRSGKLLCAELSSKRPSITAFDAAIYPELPATPVYAALTFRPDRDRRISIHDFGIDVFGKVYPCIAVRKGNAAFSGAWNKSEIMDVKSTYTMLFILDAKELGIEGKTTLSLSLKALFPPAELALQKVEFKVLGQKVFTQPNAIPASGMMTEKK